MKFLHTKLKNAMENYVKIDDKNNIQPTKKKANHWKLEYFSCSHLNETLGKGLDTQHHTPPDDEICPTDDFLTALKVVLQ